MIPFLRESRSTRLRACEVATCRRGTSLIEVGERYVRLVLPPRTDVNGSDHWWPLIAHSECATHPSKKETVVEP